MEEFWNAGAFPFFHHCTGFFPLVVCVTLTMGDGSTRTLQTKDTTALENLTGILDTAHGGTGKSTALTAEDVGAYSKTETYGKTEVYSKTEADGKFGAPYTLPAATETRLGGVKAGNGLSVTGDGTLSVTSLNGYTIKAQTADPGAGSALATGTILLVYK